MTVNATWNTTTATTLTGEEVIAMDQQYVMRAWSKQGQAAMAVEKAEGIYFWDYEGNRQVDMSSLLVNANIGHQESESREGDPGSGCKDVLHGTELCDRCEVSVGEETGRAGRRGYGARVLHECRSGCERECDQDGADRDGAHESVQRLPQLPRRYTCSIECFRGFAQVRG